MCTKIVIVLLSSACLAFLLQATAVPVNNNNQIHLLSPRTRFQPELGNGVNHLEANYVPWLDHGHDLNEYSNQLLQQSGTWTDHVHHLTPSVYEPALLYGHGHGHAQGLNFHQSVAPSHFHRGLPLKIAGQKQNGNDLTHTLEPINAYPSNWHETALPLHHHPIQDDHQQVSSPTNIHHDQDSLWAIVGESSRKFADKQSNKAAEHKEQPLGTSTSSSSLKKNPKVSMKGTWMKKINDPKDWRYQLPSEVIRAVNDKYHQLTKAKRNSSYKRLNTFATTRTMALNLLSKDVKIQQEALHAIGIPQSKGLGRREVFWGKNKKFFSETVALKTGLDLNVVIHKLSGNLNQNMADNIASIDPLRFQEGIKEFLTTSRGGFPSSSKNRRWQ